MEVGGNLSDVRDRRPLERRVACDSFISILEHVERLHSSFLARHFPSFFSCFSVPKNGLAPRYEPNTVYRSKKYSKKRLFEISIDRIADQWIPDNGSNRDVHPWHLPSGFHVSRPIGFVNDDSRRHDPFSSVRGKIALPAVNPYSRERNLAARLIVRDRIFLSPLEGHDALFFSFFFNLPPEQLRARISEYWKIAEISSVIDA